MMGTFNEDPDQEEEEFEFSRQHVVVGLMDEVTRGRSAKLSPKLYSIFKEFPHIHIRPISHAFSIASSFLNYKDPQ